MVARRAGLMPIEQVVVIAVIGMMATVSTLSYRAILRLSMVDGEYFLSATVSGISLSILSSSSALSHRDYRLA